jgi:large subunit ribosomal protein L4
LSPRSKLGLERRTLIVDAVSNDNLTLSSRNLRNVTFISPSGVNVYDLLTHEQLALTREAAAELERQLGK